MELLQRIADAWRRLSERIEAWRDEVAAGPTERDGWWR